MFYGQEALAQAEKNAHVALREAQEVIPYREGVITQTEHAGDNPLLRSHTLEITLRYENPDSLPSARALKITEDPPRKRHWTNWLQRDRRTFFYGEAPAPHGDTQRVIEIRRGKKVIYTRTQTSRANALEGHLGFGDVRALRRIAPFIHTLTTKSLKEFESKLPTQPL